MSRRYRFLKKEDIFSAFNKARDAFLAAKDGHQVDLVIDALLTHDEKIKIGRRVLVADLLREGFQYREIADLLKVGNNTIIKLEEQLDNHQEGFALIFRRSKKVEEEFKDKAYRSVGRSMILPSRKVYTGFTRKDVQR